MTTTPAETVRVSPATILLAFLRLGLTSFGGPAAHIGYFRTEFVDRRGWMSDTAYAELVALCQFLPGPASSQVGFAIGLRHGGYLGAAAAFVGFTAPSALLMLLFAAGISILTDPSWTGVIHGLKLAAAAVVAHAVLGMARGFCTGIAAAMIAAAAGAILLLAPGSLVQLAVIGGGALAGAFLLRPDGSGPDHAHNPPGTVFATLPLLIVFGLLLAACLLVDRGSVPSEIAIGAAFYEAGALVFGGGHVVLPLLETSVVDPGWMDHDTFLAGYGAAQALPGPLFALSAYLGALANPSGGVVGIAGGLIALVAIFVPGMLLVIAILPIWNRIRSRPQARAPINGINAAVVGVLAAALIDPIILSTVRAPVDIVIAIGAFLALQSLHAPPILVVAATATAGYFLT
ncbi:MAG: chromate efflux transporter [Alphaproteobacteria bacterium]